MTKHSEDTAARQGGNAASKPLTRLSADQIACRIERQRPAIARAAMASLAAKGDEHVASGADDTGAADPTVSLAGAAPISSRESEDVSGDAEARDDRSAETGHPAQNSTTATHIGASKTT